MLYLIYWRDDWQGKEALKSVPVNSDENLIYIQNPLVAVMKPVTFLMSLLPGRMASCNTLIEK